MLHSHGDKRELVVSWLLDQAVNGHIESGNRLVAQEIADAVGVSLTPVREALAELAGIGLVDLQPNRGAVLHAFSRKEIREIGKVRRALECEAVRGAMNSVPSEKLSALEKDLEAFLRRTTGGKRAVDAARSLDTRLHTLIRDGSRNSFLQKELVRLAHLFRLFRDASWKRVPSPQEAERLQEEAEEHLAIVRAMRLQDRPAAVRAMSSHIAASIRYWTQRG